MNSVQVWEMSKPNLTARVPNPGACCCELAFCGLGRKTLQEFPVQSYRSIMLICENKMTKPECSQD